MSPIHLIARRISTAGVTILVRAGQLVPAHNQPAIPNGAVAIVGETIEAIGTYDVLWDQFFLGPGKGDEAKKIIKSMYKLDSPFVRYALPSSYCVHYPRSALNTSYNNVVQNTGSLPEADTPARGRQASNRANLGITHCYQFKCALVNLFI